MIKSSIFIVLFISLSITPCISAEDSINDRTADTFFKNRVVLGVIEFTGYSDKLSMASKKYLDSLVPTIMKAQTDKKIIRFEGNIKSSLNNHGDVKLALYRAKSVQDYLRNNHNIGNLSFLGGNIQNVRVSSSEYVEIAIYNDYFKIHTAPIDEMKTTVFKDRGNR